MIMATAKIDSNNNPEKKIEQLLQEIAKLNIPDLDTFKAKFDKLFNKKKTPAYSKKEKELIEKIKNGGPSKKIYDRHLELLKKSVQGVITDAENQEALKLVPIFDKWTLERVQLMLELAKLWDVSLEDVRKRLKIKPAEIVYA